MPKTEQAPAAAVSSARATRAEEHVRNVLTVGITAAFVALLVAFTGELLLLWPLFAIPVVLSAFSYHMPGAVVTSALCAAVVGVLLPGATVPAGRDAVPELVIGFGALLVAGLAVGRQSQRHARQRRSLEATSITDPLTGLYRPSYLHTRLDEEIRRADRYGQRIGILMLAVDGFEEFEALFGRYKGEMLLRHLADIVQVTLRDTDICARFNERTFAVVMPFTGPDQVVTAAHRLRDAVADTEFEGDVLEPATKRSIGQGGCAYPECALDASGLLEETFTRLQLALAAGPGAIEAPASATEDSTVASGAARTST